MEANNLKFEETQSFKKSVLKMVLFAAALLFFYVYISQEFFDKPISDSPSNPDGLIAGGVLLFVLFVIFHFARFKTRIDSRGIKFKFSPFHLTWRHYPIDEIKTAKIKAFNPEKEFGGRGLRYSFKQKTWMYTISAGTYCIEIEKKDGGKTLLGTENREVAEKVLAAFYTP